jgi:hypothetical protein
MIRKLLIRLLRFFVKLGFIGKVASFKYTGKAVSLNDFYAAGHWKTRHDIKNEYKVIFDNLINKSGKDIFFEKFYILMFFNNRYDVDNVVGMEKLFTDAIKGRLVREDNKKYFKGLMIFYDEFLPPNTIEFVLIEIKDDGQKRTNK